MPHKRTEIKATHLLLSCVDHRCTNDLARVMPRLICAREKAHYAPADLAEAAERYDHIALPGASLGVMQTTFPAWRESFFQQLALALTLHPEIRTLVVFDHLDCGVFKRLLPTIDLGQERSAHARVTKEFADLVNARHPLLKVERWILLPRDGHDWYAFDLDNDEAHYEMCCQHCV